MTTGERIRIKREERGLSQQELAELAGYKEKSSICKIENAGDNVSTKTTIRIAKALNCDYKELFGWVDIEQTDLSSREIALARRIIAYYNMISKLQQDLLEKFNDIPKDAQDRVMNALNYEYEQSKKNKTTT